MPIVAKSNKDSGFTLVELAIVIVIIGLLVGGVLQGQSLVESSKRNKTISEINKLNSAYHLFKSKFNALPGDFANALTFFGSTKCIDNWYGTCNGDGNGYIDYISNQMTSLSGGEDAKVFMHLAASGIYNNLFNIENLRANLNPVVNHCLYNIFSSIPINSANCLSLKGAIQIYNAPFNTVIQTVNNTHRNAAASLTPEQAYSMDLKMDDGNPMAGVVLSGKGYNNANECTNATSPYSWAQTLPVNPVYNISRTNIECILFFKVE